MSDADTDVIACRRCYVEFDLGAQHYYASLCPRCYGREHGHEQTWPVCTACRDRTHPDELRHRTVRADGGGPESDYVPVCADCAD